MAYDMPSTINFTEGFTGGFVYINSITSNWFSNMLLIAIYLIFATGFYFAKKDMMGSLAVGGFAIFVVGLLFWVGGVISGVTFAFVIAVSIISFAMLWIGND